jgi:Rab family, other
VTRRVTFDNAERWLRDHTDANIVVMLVGNKADLRHLRAVSPEDAAAFAQRHGTFSMETSALDATNVERAFAEVLRQIYHVVSRNALDIGDDPAAPSRGKTIDVDAAKDERSRLLGMKTGREILVPSRFEYCFFLTVFQLFGNRLETVRKRFS